VDIGISLRNASFRYAEQDLFSNLNLDVAKGELLCILGPNGCGKTTLLRCLNGSLRLREGSVRLNGKDISSLSVVQIARVMGFVFQEHSTLFPYSVLEAVRMGRSPHLGLFSSPSKKDTEIAVASLEAVGIGRLKDKPYTKISGGERQLALIARALAQEPEVMLLDEPTSHLDFGNQILILETVERLAREKKLSIVMTTHFPNHAMMVSTKVALMKEGRFLAIGEPKQTMTETNLQRLYGVPVKVIDLEAASSNGVKYVVPLMSSARQSALVS
jgi:iron complex transport system ATP-binding protein